MRAVIFKGPGKVAVEERPTPTIQKPTDCILKVTSCALCGSDLHFYRGHTKPPPDFIIGHEFVGVVDEVGAEITKFKPGDEVVVSFGALTNGDRRH